MVNNVNSKDMKTRIIVLAILLIIVGIACERITDDPAVVEPTYIVNITCDTNKGTVIPFGEVKGVKKDQKIDITINPKLGFKGESVIVDGVKFPLTSNTYPFINGAKDSKVEVMFEKTLSWYAMQGAWNLDSVLVKQQNGTWKHMIINSRDSVLFFSTGRYKTYRDGKWIGEGNWSINELVNPPTFNHGGFIHNIGKLDDNELILETEDIIDKYSHH